MLDIYEIQNRLIFHEGLRLSIYRCSQNYRTIGVGRNLDTNPLTSEELKAVGDYEKGITKNAAMFLLRNDINRVMSELDDKIGWWVNLDDERQYALIDMCFNQGIKSLLKFKNMLSAMRERDFDKASKECLNSLYAKQVPVRSKRIAYLIKTKEWRI